MANEDRSGGRFPSQDTGVSVTSRVIGGKLNKTRAGVPASVNLKEIRQTDAAGNEIFSFTG